jgi:hypothetical protein
MFVLSAIFMIWRMGEGDDNREPTSADRAGAVTEAMRAMIADGAIKAEGAET